MKKILFAVLSAVMPLLAMAQTTDAQMATLQHGDKTTVFYGEEAFVNAYNAAADSADIITLSSGKFNVPNRISKSISVYGAGFENDTITGAIATVLNGTLYLQNGDSMNEDGVTVKGGKKIDGCHFEGLKCSISFCGNGNTPINKITIAKCNLNHATQSNPIPTSIDNIIFRQNYINNLTIYNLHCNNLLLSNCFIEYLGLHESSHRTINIDHCIIKSRSSGSNYFTGNILVTNCISYFSLSANCTSKNNIFVGNISVGTDNVGDTNWTGIGNAGIWAEEGNDGSYSEDKTFELKYPNKYIGTDGTQVGLHGGEYPWNKIPSTPRLMESNIDLKTSAEGILKVSIKVEAQTKK